MSNRINRFRTTPHIAGAAAALFLVMVGAVLLYRLVQPQPTGQTGDLTGQSESAGTSRPVPAKPGNPLSGRSLYVDQTRKINTLAADLAKEGNTADAALIEKVAQQPGTIWLTGPNASDPTAQADINTVKRTSQEAKSQGTTPVYQLYAIPRRDACAGHSSGGFSTRGEYLNWLDRILGALQTKAVFSIEADAIAHTLNNGCFITSQINDRYALLNEVTRNLKASPKVLAAYLDAAHSHWFPDPGVLVEPLKKSGLDNVRGIAVNVSFFEETSAITKWAQQLVSLTGEDKGIIIDTSRNGKGVSQASGEALWCNPPGRGIGPRPTTYVPDDKIDAYYWGKNIGESDGACFGNPPAGAFVPRIAIELARNGSEQ